MEHQTITVTTTLHANLKRITDMVAAAGATCRIERVGEDAFKWCVTAEFPIDQDVMPLVHQLGMLPDPVLGNAVVSLETPAEVIS